MKAVDETEATMVAVAETKDTNTQAVALTDETAMEAEMAVTEKDLEAVMKAVVMVAETDGGRRPRQLETKGGDQGS